VSRLVLRFAKRRASREEPTAAGVREIEFTNRKTGVVDLRPSVYAVDEGEVLRAYAEHAAAAPIDPEAAPLGIDLGVMKLLIEASDGSVKFQLTRTRHAEIIVEDVAALDALIDIARRDLPARSRISRRPMSGSSSRRSDCSSAPRRVDSEQSLEIASRPSLRQAYSILP
jgi:hypothetical protein